MSDFLASPNNESGSTPGTLIYSGKTYETPAVLKMYQPSPDNVEHVSISVKDLPALHAKPFWLDVEGIHDLDTIRTIGKHFNLHDLTLESIVTTQRPKCELYDDYLCLVLHETFFDGEKAWSNQVCLILSETFLLSFHNYETQPFAPVWNRIRRGGPRLRTRGLDYLTYALYDVIVDRGFQVLATLETKLESLEEKLIDAIRPDQESYQQINILKKQLIYMRRVYYPYRLMQTQINQIEAPLISPETQVFLRDVGDHIHQINEHMDSVRDRLNHMMELHNSLVADHTNRVVKLLTLISGIFIPLSFISGVYGMNFQSMPGITSNIGFPVTIGIMLLVALAMLLYFRLREWL